ncbi:MAG TPA: hypothetical protein VE913_14790 [Longimicrobium sp.]|nr:hypothetical protein [Longimicrobium sp.]
MPESDPSGQRWLGAAAIGSFAVAVLHLAVIFIGAPGYAYLGAGDLAPLATRGSPIPALLTSVLTALFALFGIYALSGAGRFRRLPVLRLALLAIGAVYTLRGLLLPLELYALARGAASFPPRYAVFSAMSLAIGLLYLVGTTRLWSNLRPTPASLRAPA